MTVDVIVGETVDYQVNRTFVRPAIVMNIDLKTLKADLRIFVRNDDFPEFSKEECALGTPYREGIEYGTKPGQWNLRG